MKVILLGVVVHLIALFSVLDVFICPRIRQQRSKRLGEVCDWQAAAPARRCVLLLTPGLALIPGAARGHANHLGPPTTLAGLLALTGGLRRHPLLYRMYPQFDNILSRADAVVYSGPPQIPEYFTKVTWISTFFPKEWLHLSTDVQRNDAFVFNSIHNFLKESQNNKSMKQILEGKIVFFLYLTSEQLCWQKYGDDSENIKNAAAFVEDGLYNMKKAMEYYFADDDTIFLITSAKKRPDKETPLTVLGKTAASGPVDSVSLTDVCPLLASFLGLPVPLTSEGSLPLQYLNMTDDKEAEALVCNALQLYQLAFGPDLLGQDENVKNMKLFLREGQYEKSVKLGRNLTNVSLKKINETALPTDKLLFSVIGTGLLGWIFLLLSELMILEIGFKPPSEIFVLIISLVFLLAAMISIFGPLVKWACRPIPYILYFELPLLPWFIFLFRHNVCYSWFFAHLNFKTLYYLVVLFSTEELFLYTLKGYVSPIALIAFAGFLTILPKFQKTPYVFTVWWYVISSLLIAILYVPLTGRALTRIVNFSGTLLLCISGGSSFSAQSKRNIVASVLFTFLIAAAMIACDASILVATTPLYIHVMSWILLLSVFLPLMGTKHVPDRLVHSGLAFAIPVLLLSGLHEPISYLLHIFYFLTWVFLERSFLKETITWHDSRRGIILLHMFIIGYMLIGQIKPDTSFDSFWFRCFLSEESLPLKSGLLFFKYFCLFVAMMTVYESFLNQHQHAKASFLHCLLIAEILVLRLYIEFYLTNTSPNMTRNVFYHIFIHLFLIAMMLSHAWGNTYAGSLEKKQIEQIAGFPSAESMILN